MKAIEAGENIAGGDEKMRRDGLETNIGKKAIHPGKICHELSICPVP
jgi:hypothetical protein